ncbi:AAA family ATPase [Chitinivibrio alkaliphilus]|uniref:Replication-associated recombination protein A n=1 Tax=Chitinivibrio alkaliphilus ACht1 TaxID=1313304 RepID=U7D931_9BACT|nr:AAA family ATPase [Chitinivibrio alkaliphilus]ERP30905.1 recombination protein MgsA [Chitinivibrio alkaliphilus ACht1]
MDLFESAAQERQQKQAPLADRMRPRNLDEFVGQQKIIGHGRLLRRAIEADQLSSLIFYGPPGCGKTTLARIIANHTKAQFISLNAVLSGVKDIRESITEAQRVFSLYSKRTILFIDEVHRFNKSQQDALLPHVESGCIILIGATTENPYFEVNKALVSRSRIFQLKELDAADISMVVDTALEDTVRGFGERSIFLSASAREHLCKTAAGDARTALNALELAVITTTPDETGHIHLDLSTIEESIQRRAVLYDKDGDAHYDTISAFIKSIRGSDPDAALYWLAKMVYAGEDPRFLFRRMIILASEDIGLADPAALGYVMSAAQAYDYIGMPEGQYPLAQACLYLATAKKSNTTMAFFDALSAVRSAEKDRVPSHLKDANRDGDLGDGAGYLYPHAYRDHWVAQQYLPDTIRGRVFYTPSQQGYEREINDMVMRRRELQVETILDSRPDGGGNIPHASWEQRTWSGDEQYYEQLRDSLVFYSDVTPTDLVLDIHAKTGFISLEMLRHARQGGVWSIVRSQPDEEVFRSHLSATELERPRIVSCKHMGADTVAVHIPPKVEFDLIVGKDLFSYSDVCEELSLYLSQCSGACRLVFSQIYPGQGSRISEFIPPEYGQYILSAEENVYKEEESRLAENRKMVDALLETHGYMLTTHPMEASFLRRISKNQIVQWCSPGGRIYPSIAMKGEAFCREYQQVLLHHLGKEKRPWKIAFTIYRYTKK